MIYKYFTCAAKYAKKMANKTGRAFLVLPNEPVIQWAGGAEKPTEYRVVDTKDANEQAKKVNEGRGFYLVDMVGAVLMCGTDNPLMERHPILFV